MRTEEKGEQAKKNIIEANQDCKGTIDIIGGCDLLDLNKVATTGTNLVKLLETPESQPLNTVIHNAGLMSSRNDETSTQQYDAMFQTNVLGPQLLQHYIDPFLLKDDDQTLKRIVWVSSYGHFLCPSPYSIYWEDPTFKNVPAEKKPRNMELYGQSKACNIYQAQAWYDTQKKQAGQIGCVSVSCYPGNLNTDLTRSWNARLVSVMKWVLFDGVYDAYSEPFGALSPTLKPSDSGSYIVPFGEIHEAREDVKAGLTNGVAQQVWEYCESLISPFKTDSSLRYSMYYLLINNLFLLSLSYLRGRNIFISSARPLNKYYETGIRGFPFPSTKFCPVPRYSTDHGSALKQWKLPVVRSEKGAERLLRICLSTFNSVYFYLRGVDHIFPF